MLSQSSHHTAPSVCIMIRHIPSIPATSDIWHDNHNLLPVSSDVQFGLVPHSRRCEISQSQFLFIDFIRLSNHSVDQLINFLLFGVQTLRAYLPSTNCGVLCFSPPHLHAANSRNYSTRTEPAKSLHRRHLGPVTFPLTMCQTVVDSRSPRLATPRIDIGKTSEQFRCNQYMLKMYDVTCCPANTFAITSAHGTFGSHTHTFRIVCAVCSTQC